MMKLHERGICMTDLKPANTLYDKKTKTAKLVDLAGAVRNEDLHSCKLKHVNEFTPKYTAPELKNNHKDHPEYSIDLTKCISWTIVHMMEVISSKIKEFEEPITNKEIKRIYYEVIFLKNDLKFRKPLGRITLEKGLKKLMKIPELETTVVKDFESYVNLLKKSFNSEDPNMPEALNLKNDI